MSIKSFMWSYKQQTTPNPLQAQERVWQRRAALDVWATKTEQGSLIWLGSVRSFVRGTGTGTACLEWLVALAREHGVVLAGVCSPCGKKRPRLEYRHLKAWYQRHGFIVRENGQMYLT